MSYTVSAVSIKLVIPGTLSTTFQHIQLTLLLKLCSHLPRYRQSCQYIISSALCVLLDQHNFDMGRLTVRSSSIISLILVSECLIACGFWSLESHTEPWETITMVVHKAMVCIHTLLKPTDGSTLNDVKGSAVHLGLSCTQRLFFNTTALKYITEPMASLVTAILMKVSSTFPSSRGLCRE